MRVAAITLLALMCLDLGMDFVQGETGDSQDAVVSFFVARTAPVLTASTPTSSSNDLSHECFCCCSHLEPQGSLIVSVILKSNPGYSDGVARSLDPELFHGNPPPQAIL